MVVLVLGLVRWVILKPIVRIVNVIFSCNHKLHLVVVFLSILFECCGIVEGIQGAPVL